MGVFPELRMTHLIPRERISENFFVNLMEANTATDLLLAYKWKGILPGSPLSARTLLSTAKSIILDAPIERRMKFAKLRGWIQAKKIIDIHHASPVVERQR
jgi:hypothetical protein